MPRRRSARRHRRLFRAEGTSDACRARVTVHGDSQVAAYGDVIPAEDKDFAEEYLSLDLAVAVVDLLTRRCSTSAATAPATPRRSSPNRRPQLLDSPRSRCAAVLVNASSRFVDGGEFGFGAEIGISTQKLHAARRVSPEMTSTKYVVTGSGQVRQ